MKQKIAIYILSICCLAMISCGDNKSDNKKKYKTYEDLENSFRESLTKEDSTIVLQSAYTLMEELRKGEMETALGRLSMIENGQIVPLAGEQLDNLKRRFTQFPVVNYKLDYFYFSTSQLNDIKYTIEFAPRNAKGKAPTVSFMLNPMKLDGQWYLCLKEEKQSTKEHPIHPKTVVFE